jgi:hypothetical protein
LPEDTPYASTAQLEQHSSNQGHRY